MHLGLHQSFQIASRVFGEVLHTVIKIVGLVVKRAYKGNVINRIGGTESVQPLRVCGHGQIVDGFYAGSIKFLAQRPVEYIDGIAGVNGCV